MRHQRRTWSARLHLYQCGCGSFSTTNQHRQQKSDMTKVAWEKLIKNLIELQLRPDRGVVSLTSVKCKWGEKRTKSRNLPCCGLSCRC